MKETLILVLALLIGGLATQNDILIGLACAVTFFAIIVYSYNRIKNRL